jgi:hypothetical protein
MDNAANNEAALLPSWLWSLARHCLVLTAFMLASILIAVSGYSAAYHWLMPEATHLSPLFFDYRYRYYSAHPYISRWDAVVGRPHAKAYVNLIPATQERVRSCDNA